MTFAITISSTARATVVYWVVECYKNSIIYRYRGEQSTEELPQYEILGLSDGYIETVRDIAPELVAVTYENQNGDIIYFDYSFMYQGTQTYFVLNDDDVLDVMVNQMDGKFIESHIPGKLNCLTWIVPDLNIQFSIERCFDFDSVLHMAESVSLCKVLK